MKKILFVCAMVLFSSIGLFAQAPQGFNGNGGGNMQERMKQRIENYTKELKLDAKKTAEFKKIYNESQEIMRKEMEKAREAGANADRDAMRQKMTKVNTDRDAKIKKVLSADEYKKYQDIIKKEQESRGQGGPGGQGGGNRPRGNNN